MRYSGRSLGNKPMIMMLVGVGLLFAGIFGFQATKRAMFQRAMHHRTAVVVTVSASPARYQWWQPFLLSYGSLRAVKGVNVTTESSGLVRKIYFQPGAIVVEGDALVQLNADSDVALLHALEAQEKLAEITYNRDRLQFAAKAISKAVLDSDEQSLRNLQAQCAQQTAIVAKKTLTAPFTGRLGICAINPGQYLNAGDQVVPIQVLDPLYADFYVPQQNLAELKLGAPVRLRSDTYPDEVFTGTLTTINPVIDTTTRNVEVEATISNPHWKLYPGMFVSVELDISKKKRYLILPQTAVIFNSYGEMAYVIQKKGQSKQNKPILSAAQVFVVTGEKRGDQVAIMSGLREGDLVVTGGQLKLKKDSLVVVSNPSVPREERKPVATDE